ncbi:hypothetical protein, partial [Arthrobacter pityocampae]|uniref:hypothetical protein n=1 Tax=Arthrobacter pityocampae TaxID=547334 RepID=UPI003736AB98
CHLLEAHDRPLDSRQKHYLVTTLAMDVVTSDARPKAQQHRYLKGSACGRGGETASRSANGRNCWLLPSALVLLWACCNALGRLRVNLVQRIP